ncbi:Bardet-Biedl syndrome 9 [Lycorma delicatula]|uniref:Bardet-Biedl syndrome 9 n=1 Tax=Lycorma delicatula TaxID=130591 RepID=UPI003F50FFC0
MSLFKSRELWVTQCGKDETFDCNLLLLVDLRGKGCESIIVGSHNGLLRIYNPQSDPEIDSLEFRPTDLLIEIQLPHPILQLAFGKLVSGSQSYHLGILHSNSLAVYTLVTVSGSAEHGDQSQLILVYEHPLNRSAYDFIVGPFGGIKGRDFICIQSLDGTLSFYEQETFAFKRSLSTFLIPSPIVYVPHSDSFIIFNANWYLESYKYGTLGDNSGRKLVPTWKYNLGEELIDIKVITWMGSEETILVLGDRNLYCFREGGSVRFVKRLQYQARCFYPYIVEPDRKLMLLVVSDTNTLLIYDQTMLCWSSQLSITPVFISRINFQAIKGLVVLLSETGSLQCCYLGTEPALFVAPPVKNCLKSFEEVEEKLNNLQKQIAAYSQNSQSLTQLSPAHELSITARVINNNIDDNNKSCRILIELEPSAPLNNVQVTINCQPTFKVEGATHFIVSLCQKSELICEVIPDTDLYNIPAFSLELLIISAYLTNDLTPQVSQTTVQLPLALAVQVTTPEKESLLKITLSTSLQPLPLSQLFSEFTGQLWDSYECTDNAVGLQFCGVPDSNVTIIISKNSSRYRVQSNNVTAITLIINHLINRLEMYYSSRHKEISITHQTASLPLQSLMDIIEKHISLRNKSIKLQEELGIRSAQFRVIQRRLLAKLRDKTPTSLTGLDILLRYSYENILEFSHELENTLLDLKKCGCELSSAVRLILILIKLSECAVQKDLEDLTAALSYTLYKAENQGWEEVCEAGVCYLLQTSLAKSVRDHQRTCINPLKEIGRFKKHIAGAIDRVLVNSQNIIKDEQRGVSPILEGDEEQPLSGRKERRLSFDSNLDGISKPSLLSLRKQNTIALDSSQIENEESVLNTNPSSEIVV